MTTTRTVADSYAERLLAATDKRKATTGILQRMNKLRYKGHSEPIPAAGKRKIINLIRVRISQGSAPKSRAARTYASMIAYMLEQIEYQEE
jgi:hypothetical protein